METGEIRELTLIDKETGEDIAGTVIACKQYNNPTAIYCCNSDCYIMDEEDFEFFANYFDTYDQDEIADDIEKVESDIIYEMSGMPCKIYDTWEIKELSYIDDEGVERAFDFIYCSGAIGETIIRNNDNGFYYMSIDEFNFWHTYFINRRGDNEKLKRLKKEFADEYDTILDKAVREIIEDLYTTITPENEHEIIGEVINYMTKEFNNG